MFEKFTNRARHVVVLSQEEARLMNHNYIGTEHILLGLLGEPESVAGSVLASFGITRDGVRTEVEEIIGMGTSQPTGHIPFTPRAKKTLELSLREALAIKHNYIGTEHILLGLIREGDGLAIQIMRRHADPAEIRAAVLNALPTADPAESAEGTDETNAVLRWLRQRLSRHGTSVPFRPDLPGADVGTRGTPAVEAALQQAARLAGPLPVGSHHLLLAALEDSNSAASWALTSLGVDIDDLRRKLRSAKVTGTTDEQPEQAGRRQMTIQVTDDALTIVATDPLIVTAGKAALRAVNTRAAAEAAERASAVGEAGGEASAEKSAAGQATAGAAADGAAADGAAADGAAADGGDISAAEAGDVAAASTVIRGDDVYAAGLANVWLELRKTLNKLADPTSGRQVKVAVRPPAEAGPAEIDPREVAEGGKPDNPEAAAS